MSTDDPYENLEAAEAEPDVPDWDDEYLDRVSDRLMFNYDLERDYRVEGEPLDLYGEMEMHHEKHFFHPALSFGHHDNFEYVFARREDQLRVDTFDRLAELGHGLGDAWIDADEEHYSTEFVFVLVADGGGIPDAVREHVSSFSDRTMLNHGYYGHYEIHLVAVDPEREEIVSSRGAHVEEAFRLWERIEETDPSWWDLLTRRLQL